MKNYIRPVKTVNNIFVYYQGFLPAEIDKKSVDDFPEWLKENGFDTGAKFGTRCVDIIDENGDILKDYQVSNSAFDFIVSKLKLEIDLSE